MKRLTVAFPQERLAAEVHGCELYFDPHGWALVPRANPINGCRWFRALCDLRRALGL
jgi:hypothetical protein